MTAEQKAERREARAARARAWRARLAELEKAEAAAVWRVREQTAEEVAHSRNKGAPQAAVDAIFSAGWAAEAIAQREIALRFPDLAGPARWSASAWRGM